MLNKFSLYILIIFLAFAACKSKEPLINKGMSTNTPGIAPQKGGKGKNNAPLFFDAVKQKYLGNIEEAEKLYMQCLEIDPSDAASMFELANIYIIRNQFTEALIMSEKAAATDPDNTYYQLLLASLYQQNEDYHKSSEIFEDLVKKNPDDFDFQNQLAISYIYEGKYDAAVKVYDLIEDKVGVTEELSIKKQKIYLQQNKFNKAIEEIEKLNAKFPNESKYYAILAELYMDYEMFDKAHDAYQKILELDPTNPYIHISLADYYKNTGEEEKSFNELKLGFANQNLEIDSKVQILLSYYSMTEIYADIKDDALELAEILIEAHPEDPKSYSIYADLLVQDKQYEKARNSLRKVIALDSSKYVVWEQLILVESEMNDMEAMYKESKLAIELFPEQPLPYLFAGAAGYQKKEWDACIQSLKSGLNYVIDNPRLLIQFHTYLGDAYNQQDNHSLSDESYDKVLELDPDNDYVLNNYAYYLSLRNDKLDLAAKMAKRASELKPNSSANQDTYGWVLYKMGYFGEAKEWIEKAISNGAENNPVILEHYGDVLFKLGDTDQAVMYWEKAQDAGKGSEFLDKKVEDKTLYE